jgi:uncharacterized protein (TIGR03067 family)
MRGSASLLVGAGLACLAAVAHAENKAVGPLRGDWVLQSLEREGEPLAFAEKGDHFTLTEGRVAIDTSADMIRDWEYRIDDEKSPKQFDLTPLRRNRAKARFTLLGIYKLEGNRLTICIADPGGLLAKAKEAHRPTDFKPSPGETLLIFERGTR